MNEPTETDTPGRRLNAAEWRAIISASPLEFEVISDSMRPVYRKGDRVLIRPIREKRNLYNNHLP